MKVKKDTLLVIAGVVWIIAGANVANLGIQAFGESLGISTLVSVLLAVGAIAIFFGFHAMFGKIVKSNSSRIRSLEDRKHSPFHFLDARGYLIMAVMMIGGFSLRFAGLIPAWFVAFFYTGLGFALALAGASFLAHRVHGEGWTFHHKREVTK